MKNYRQTFQLTRENEVIDAVEKWDEQDNLCCETPFGELCVPDENGETPAKLIEQLNKHGYEVRCCVACRFFWYGGMAANCGATKGSCMQGKTQWQFKTIDDVSMLGLCDAFESGSEEDRVRTFKEWERKTKPSTP